MDWQVLSAEDVDAIHDDALNAGELTGRALDKSLDSALARVENRIAYGLVEDVYDLAALYAMAIAQGHCFNDANKRTAYSVMITILDLNGAATPAAPVNVIGDRIIALAQGQTDEVAFADWLRDNAG